MRFAPWLMAALLLGGGARAAEPVAKAATRTPAKPGTRKPAPVVEYQFTAAEIEKLAGIEAMAKERYPKRRDTPLRYVNISDNEVREIQTLASHVHMSELVNISPVVTGCACEEGADCTEQVYIIGRYKDRQVGLQLSRFKKRWSIGRVQRWWLDYAALLAREKVTERNVYEQAHARALLEFPQCPSGTTLDRRPATTASTAPAPATR